MGICLAGNFEQAPPTEEQITALAATIKSIRKLYGDIPYEGHKDVDPKEHPTACPGRLFPWDELKKELTEEAVPMDNWKNVIILDAKAKGLISGEHNPDDPAGKWFVLQVALNVLKKLGK